MPDPTNLDGCVVEFDNPAWNTPDGDVDALVMFADVFDNPDAVERRRAELVEWSEANDGS
jgi:hypothetical protein